MLNLDGKLDDWSESDRLDRGPYRQDGYKLFGRLEGDRYVFAIEAPAGSVIGNGTTAFLNVDYDKTTGSNVFDTIPAGVEYYINFDANGTPGLFRASDHQYVGTATTIQSIRSEDKNVVEFSIARDAIGAGPDGLGALFQVNGNAFFPQSYASG